MKPKKHDAIGEAVRAGEIDQNSNISISVANGPAGSGGFRTGHWHVTIGGIKFMMYASVSHTDSLEGQAESLMETARRRIEHAYDPNHTSQSTRA